MTRQDRHVATGAALGFGLTYIGIILAVHSEVRVDPFLVLPMLMAGVALGVILSWRASERGE